MSTEFLNLTDAVHVTVRPSIVKRMTQSGTRHLVKWKVGSADKTRAHDSSTAAQTFQTDLRTALRNREKFDSTSGLPESMLLADAEETVLDLACELVEEEWAGWSGGNRRARVEALADLCALLVDGTRGRPSRELMRRWARDKELPPEGRRTAMADERIGSRVYTVADQEKAADWLIEHSLPVSALADTRLVKKVLTAAAASPSGVQYAPDTVQRSRSSLSALCVLAVEKKLLATNPVRDTKRKVDDEADEVDPAMVPKPEHARKLVDAACAVSPIACRQYRAYLTLLWTTGMRPSEASGLYYDSDLVLPEEGWGRVTLRKPMIHPGKRWTTTGKEHFEDRDRLKARKRRAVRTVLLPPETVRAIREHIEVNKVQRGARLFTNSNGKPIDPSSLSKVWRKARVRAFPGGEFASLTTYELRHTAATTMLEAGISVPRVAKQLGNSPATLMRVYARVMDTDDKEFMDSFDKGLE
jgi:integrase